MSLDRRIPIFLSVVATLAVVATGVSRPAAAGEWKPVLVDKDGKQEAFPARPEALKDKEWLTVQYTPYEGYRPRLAVVYANEKVGTPEMTNEWTRLLLTLSGKAQQQMTNPFDHIEDLVSTALGETHRFSLLERSSALQDVTGEQDFGASGRVEKKTAAAIGKMKGADFIVKPTIIELNPEKDASKISGIAGAMGARGFGIGSLGISGKVAFCRLHVKVINSTTGEIVQEMTADGTAKSTGLDLGGGALGVVGSKVAGGGLGFGRKKQAPLSDAMDACANKIAYLVATRFEDLPWQGAVAAVNGAQVMINGGTNVGLKPGMTLEVSTKGDEITDPDTGESLGFQMTPNGRLRVVSCQEKFSTCEIAEGGEGLKKGDIVRLVAAK